MLGILWASPLSSMAASSATFSGDGGSVVASFRALPEWLLEAGLKVFNGDHVALQRLIQTTREPILLKKGTKLRLVQPPNDNSITKLMWEPADGYGLQKGSLVSDVKAGATVVDIGANLGYFTISVARLQPTLHILAVEPVPLTYFYFLWNCWINNVRVRIVQAGGLREHTDPGVDAVNAAIGRDGEQTTLLFNPNRTQETVMQSMFYRNPMTLGCGQINSGMRGKRCVSKMGNQTNQIHRVTVPSLDVYAQLQRMGNAAGDVAVMKVDCEGCEVTFLSEKRVREWFTDNMRVKHVVGETHEWAYSGFQAADVKAMKQAFQKRGCKWDGQVRIRC